MLLDFMTFLGIAVLSMPVWSLNKRKKQLTRLENAFGQDTAKARDESVQELADELIEERKKDTGDWRGWDEFCLWLGYGLLLGASFLRLFIANP